MNFIFYLFLSISLVVGFNNAQAQKKQPSNCSLEEIEQLLEYYKEEGTYDKLLPYAEVGVEKAAKKFGKQDTTYATMLYFLGLGYDAQQDFSNAEKYLKQAIEIQKVKMPMSKKHARSLNNLGILYYNLGNYTASEPLFKEAANIRKETLGERHPEYAFSLMSYYYSLIQLAATYFEMGNYVLVEPLYKEALQAIKEVMEIKKENLGENHSEYVTSLNSYGSCLNSLAALYYRIGNYVLAESLYKEALLLGEKHPEYPNILNNLAILYKEMGNYAFAEPLYKEAAKIRKEALGEKHPDYAQSLNNLGLLYVSMGNYALAEPLYKESIKIYKEALGEKHPDYATSLNNLAVLYMDMSNNALAELFFKEVLQIRKEALGEEHPDYASCLNNLALLYHNMGNYVLAEPLYKESLKIQKEILGEKHSGYAAYLNNLALLYSDMGKYALAEPLQKEALQIQKEVLGENHPAYATSLNNLALFYNKIGNHALAEPLIKESLKIRKEILGEKHPSYADGLNNLAGLYWDMGNYAPTESLYKEALQIYKETLGEKHPNYVMSLNNLGILFMNMSDYPKAIPFYTEALNINKNNLAQNFAWLSQKGKNAYWQKNKIIYQDLNNFAAVANKLPAASELAYQGNLISKALLLETSRELEEAITKSKDPLAIQVYSQLKEKRNQHAHLLSSGTGKRDILDRLEQEADSLDKILVARMGEYAATKRKFEITWKDVQAGLKEKEAAIEFARYYDNKEEQYKYLALVLRPNYKHPKVVKLGSENAITAIPAGKGFADLYELIWTPMDSLFEGVETVYYSPDGYLNNISFAAFCLKGTETIIETKDTIRGGTIKTSTQITGCNYLNDRYTLHQISTTRYLAEGLKHSKIDRSILIFGGVDYETIPTDNNILPSPVSENDALAENILRNSTSQNRMLYLPGTHAELQNLQEVLNGNKWQVRAHSDKNASENTLKSEVKKESPSVLHIATHGFAFPEIEQKKFFKLDDKKAYRDADNPMVRCGLLFAGANHSWMGDADMMLTKTGEDGILTALEVSALPLKNTKLVVLSACETGLGKIEGSEGTFGLKRGFKLAGVEQIIVSLWSVPDKETMELMGLFYEDLAKTHDAVISFDKAQKTMRDKYTDRPDLWAGFVLVR